MSQIRGRCDNRRPLGGGTCLYPLCYRQLRWYRPHGATLPLRRATSETTHLPSRQTQRDSNVRTRHDPPTAPHGVIPLASVRWKQNRTWAFFGHSYTCPTQLLPRTNTCFGSLDFASPKPLRSIFGIPKESSSSDDPITIPTHTRQLVLWICLK